MNKLMFLSVALLALSAPLTVAAASSCSGSGEAELAATAAAVDEYISELPGPYIFEQPIAGKTSVNNLGEYIQVVYKFALGIVGIVAVVIIMLGGLRWISAAGNETIIGEAKTMITSAVVGLTIALLSYVILLFINPRLVETDFTVAKIPVPLGCPDPPPVTIAIPPETPGIISTGQLCPAAVAELQTVADYMVKNICPTCKIGIGSTLRDHKEQARLYECYTRAVSELGVKDGSKCPEGCSSCNLALEPCCSKHELGLAVDIWLQGVPPDFAAPSSADKLQAYQNNGGSGGKVVDTFDCSTAKDISLCRNQYFLRGIMTANGSKFKGVSDEWWHFEYKGECGVSGGCKPVDGGYADNTYCKATAGAIYIYTKANCGGVGTVTCPSSVPGYEGVTWNIGGKQGCHDGEYLDFQAKNLLSVGVYNVPPTCTKP